MNILVSGKDLNAYQSARNWSFSRGRKLKLNLGKFSSLKSAFI
jgi:hypothetical protein